jgi:hypothetical protein
VPGSPPRGPPDGADGGHELGGFNLYIVHRANYTDNSGKFGLAV